MQETRFYHVWSSSGRTRKNRHWANSVLAQCPKIVRHDALGAPFGEVVDLRGLGLWLRLRIFQTRGSMNIRLAKAVEVSAVCAANPFLRGLSYFPLPISDRYFLATAFAAHRERIIKLNTHMAILPFRNLASCVLRVYQSKPVPQAKESPNYTWVSYWHCPRGFSAAGWSDGLHCTWQQVHQQDRDCSLHLPSGKGSRFVYRGQFLGCCRQGRSVRCGMFPASVVALPDLAVPGSHPSRRRYISRVTTVIVRWARIGLLVSLPKCHQSK